MKFSLICILAASAQAFTARPFGSVQTPRGSVLFSRPDSSAAVEAALAASKEFGPASKEARLAWEAVEEMDSADNSASYKGGISDAECLVEDLDDACKDYYSKLSEMASTVHSAVLDFDPQKEKVKSLIGEIQAIKLASPDDQVGKDSPALQQAVAIAQEATAEFGATSKEAKLAWEDVEEIAAARNYENAMGGTLEDECLVEKIEACEGLDELKRVLNI